MRLLAGCYFRVHPPNGYGPALDPYKLIRGAPNNPMGVAAMTLSGGEYAIHGTNRPESIGRCSGPS